MNWSKTKANNNGKSTTQYLELLINRHQDINLSLPIEYHNGTIISIKLLKTVKDIDTCKLAYFKPTDSIQGIISDLYASRKSYAPKSNANKMPVEALVVDRSYHTKLKNKNRKDHTSYVRKTVGGRRTIPIQSVSEH